MAHEQEPTKTNDRITSAKILKLSEKIYKIIYLIGL